MVRNYIIARYLFFKWRYSLSLTKKIVLSFGMAFITGIMAQIKISLPFTPVPITCQTFAVLISGVLLGKYWGGISQLVYVILGISGIPWFAGATGGYNILFGSTGGYLIGFIFAASFLGYFTDKYIRARNFLPMFCLMLFANFFLIYIPGLIQLKIWLSMIKGEKITLIYLFNMGLFPFIPGDILKIIIASLFTKIVTPKESFNGEVDIEEAKKFRIF